MKNCGLIPQRVEKGNSFLISYNFILNKPQIGVRHIYEINFFKTFYSFTGLYI